MTQFGIMQGRLSSPPSDRIQEFPWKTWQDEFDRAHKLGLDGIEWIFDDEDYDKNPLWTIDGREEIKAKIKNSGVPIMSVCADIFMRIRLAGGTEEDSQLARDVLPKLIEYTADVGVSRILMPLLETSSVLDEDLRQSAIAILKEALPIAQKHGVVLGFEMDLPGHLYVDFLDRLNHPNARAYYDCGNAAALGYDPVEEAHLLGDRICAVHIKDRELNGGTVPLGQGSMNFPTFFQALTEIGFAGPFVLQTAFGPDFEGFARRHLDFVRDLWAQAQQRKASL